MAPPSERLFALGSSYLERQSWYEASAPRDDTVFTLVDCSVLRDSLPGLGRLIVEREGRCYHLVLGWRRATEVADVLGGRDAALMGAAEDQGLRVVVYDALADDELALEVLALATDGAAHATRVRRVSSLVSHASLVFDERLFMKCYRVLEQGERPEVEAVMGLDRVGFNALLAPVGHWSALGRDLALVREFLPSALEGRLLALTSLRDLLAHASDSGDTVGSRVLSAIGETFDPADLERATGVAGGDLASEMRRLGATTASLHRALALAFGTHELHPDRLARSFATATTVVPLGSEGALDGAALAARSATYAPAALGRAIRVHGDYHLRRVMRADAGWLVAGFGDDPLYASASRDGSLPARVGSPIEDLADMWFALEAVAREALAQRGAEDRALAAALAAAWARRNQLAFLLGYLESDDAAELRPEDPAAVSLLLAGFLALRLSRYEATSAPS